MFPGPRILSTRGTVSVPKARAAIAWLSALPSELAIVVGRGDQQTTRQDRNSRAEHRQRPAPLRSPCRALRRVRSRSTTTKTPPKDYRTANGQTCTISLPAGTLAASHENRLENSARRPATAVGSHVRTGGEEDRSARSRLGPSRGTPVFTMDGKYTRAAGPSGRRAFSTAAPCLRSMRPTTASCSSSAARARSNRWRRISRTPACTITGSTTSAPTATFDA